MKIATFNINGIKARLPRLVEWLEEFSPDVACLQEIKSIDENFPRIEIEALGYHVETHGQKAFNGVALLSKEPMQDILRGLPDMTVGPMKDGELSPEQSRYMEATVSGVRIATIYLPNGNPIEENDAVSGKFSYKLDWMDKLIGRAKYLLSLEVPVVLAGDYNVIPKDIDCYNPKAWVGDALTQRESRDKYNTILHLGYMDAMRQIKPQGHAFTFWDYQRGAWPKDDGIRIDHLLLSAQAADRLSDCQVDRDPRGKDTPSDHTPVWIELKE